MSLIDLLELSSLNGIEVTIEVGPVLWREVEAEDLKGQGQATLVRSELGMIVSISDGFLWSTIVCLV
jgi:hypothetical protein